jgi:REP element-mobilizing transposase RayT
MFETRPLSVRRQTRLESSAYTNRAVFLTICAFQRQHLFGVARLIAGVARVELTVPGEILQQEWFRHARQLSPTVDVFVVMPNHLHGIVRPGNVPLAEFVGRVKSAVTSRARVEDSIQRVWQRGFYDRILRNDIELDAARKTHRDGWRFCRGALARPARVPPDAD